MKNRSSHLKIVAGTLALGLLIFGCGKKEGSPASTPSSSGESPSRQSAPTSSMKLPEFHGLYALDGDRLVELGKNAKFEDCKLGPGANFLFFDKAVSTGLSSLAESPHLQRYGFVRYQVSGVSGNTDLAGFQAATVTTVNDWRKQGKPVECRTKPVEKQAEMIQIVPPEPLQPGAYAMEGSKAVFVVSLEKSLPFDEFPESYRPASELDAVVADGKLLASRSLESKDWKRALELIQGGLKISPASPDFLELQKTAYYGSAMQEATRLEEAQEFGAAFKAYGLARVWRSSDEAANAGIARVKEQATRDPAAFVEIGKSVVGKSECIQDLAFNSDGTSVTVVSGCPTRNEPLTVLTFDGNLGSVIAKFEKENSYAIMTSFALSPDASVLAIGSPDSPYSGDDRRISLWDVASNKTLKSFENLDGKFHFLDFDASKTLILARDWNECIQLWNVAAAGRPITPKRVPWEGYFISTGTFSRDGKLFAAAAEIATTEEAASS